MEKVGLIGMSIPALGKRALFRKYKFHYSLASFGLLYFLIFKYIPMAGIIVAFKDIMPFDGLEEIIRAPFVGFKHFKAFFNSVFFWQVLRNTVIISLMYLFIGFPCPIILSLMINEINNTAFKRVFQTVSYLPHFLSMVVVTGMVRNILSTDGGLLNTVIEMFGGEPVIFLGSNSHIRWVFTFTAIWQSVGWGSIVYLAALMGIPSELYEAAIVDGASRLQRLWHISLPGMMPIISIMLILQVGHILDSGFERVFLLYSPSVYEAADIIDTFVYRRGILELQYSFSTAVGLFKSIVAFILMVLSNWFARKAGQEGLW
jgi:putative aldouronate transport system permease protein